MPEHLTNEVAPHDGGCWYCHKADENLVFSIEWDAYVHPACVREALERDPQDDEAWAIARELGIAAEIITELRALRKRVDEWEARYSNLLRQYEALLRGVTIRVKEDPEFEALRWLAKVVETSGAWLRSKSGPQPKAILAALAEWRRVRDEVGREGSVINQPQPPPEDDTSHTEP